jgi:DNA-binding NarL/FixJ family response regulator
MKRKIYALYKGETLLADGTVNEIAEKMGVKISTVRYYKTNAYQRRSKHIDKRRVLVCLED